MAESVHRVVPPWATPYIPDFQRIARVVDLAPGFMLIPVELPGPALARALAAWLTEAGHPVEVIQPADEDAWRGLAATLLTTVPAGEGAVLVAGSREASPGVWAGLGILNQRRDSVGQHLGRPLLWCGPKEFLDLTWRAAPDFWSIGDVPRRIEVVPVVEVLPEPPQSFDTLSSEDSPDRLHGLYEDAKEQGDRRNAARIGTRLGEVLYSDGDHQRAEHVAREVLALLVGAGEPGLEAAAHEILGRTLLGGDALDASESELRAALEGYRAAADRHGVARTLGEIGRTLMQRRRLDDALNLHVRALKVFEELGDRRAGAIALADIARIRRKKGDLDEAITLDQQALEVFEQLGDRASYAIALSDIARARRDKGEIDEALRLHDEELKVFEELGFRGGCAMALGDIASIRRDKGQLDEARELYERALEMYEELGESRLRAMTLIEIASIAQKEK